MAENVIVDGIGIFEKTFSEFKDSFVIIGGAACRATLSDGRYTPRKTKDIDMVLVLDRLDKNFIDTFWTFIKSGLLQLSRKAYRGKERASLRISGFDNLP